MSTRKLLGILVLATPFVHGTSQQQFIESICNSLAPFTPEITGYIKHENFFDSRQIVAFGDGESLLWPENKKFDACCTDINAQSQFNMIPLETRVDLRWCGPQIGNAKSSLFMEGDFFGPSDPLTLIEFLNIVQLRHAVAQLAWDHCKLMIGHCWHPLTTLDCYPNVISNNSGSPFDPSSLCSQVRITYKKGIFSILAAALMQLNYPSTGPLGLSTTYERNSLVPNVHTQAYIETDTILLGCGIDYKLLKPRLSTDTGYKTSTKIGSSAAILYGSIKTNHTTLQSKLIYGQNMTDLSMLGGYAVHDQDPITHKADYTTLDVMSWWADITITKNQWEPGLFVGLSKNLGAPKSIKPHQPDTIYALGPDIDILARISPRIRWSCTETFVLGVEAEYTSAAYGTIQKDGSVTHTDTVGNLRMLVALFYNF